MGGSHTYRCVGDYTAAQGLCTLIFGVFGGDTSKVFGAAFDVQSMADWAGAGPGPKTSIGKIFGEGVDTLDGIRWLRAHADEQV